jgi:hypothetical protein
MSNPSIPNFTKATKSFGGIGEEEQTRRTPNFFNMKI